MANNSKAKAILNVMKNQKFIIVFGVIVLTIVTLRVSYASFFTVKTNTNNQTITTGTLNVSYISGTQSITKQVITAESDEEGMKQQDSSVIYIQNSGTLDSVFTLNIGYDMENFSQNPEDLIPLDYVMIAVYERQGEVTNETLVVGPISITELPIYRLGENDNYYNNRYSLMVGNIGGTTTGNSTKTYKIKTWVSAKAPQTVSYTYYYLNTEIVAEVEHAKMSYNISGVIKDTANNLLNGAMISFHNNSYSVTTGADGAYTFNNIYPGVYNIDITYNNNVYSGNLTVSEGNTVSITSLGSTFSNKNIYEATALYGTTIDKIINKNSFTGSTKTLGTISGNLMPTYEITGTTEDNLNLNISLDIANNTFTMSM